MGVFDCRAFVTPSAEEAKEAFIWRQREGYRNCVSGYAQHYLTGLHGRKTAHKMLMGQSTDDRLGLVNEALGGAIPTHRLRGRCIYRKTYEVPIRETIEDPDRLLALVDTGKIKDPDALVTRSYWYTDMELPWFGTGLNYLDSFLGVE